MSKKMAQTFHSYDDSKYFWDISRSLLKESLFVFWSEVLSHKTDTVTFFCKLSMRSVPMTYGNHNS